MIDHEVGTHLSAPIRGLGTGCRADDMGLGLSFQELGRERADCSRASNDEHAVDTGRQRVLIPEHGLRSGDRADRKRCDVGERKLVRDLGENSVIHCYALCPGAISRHISGATNTISRVKVPYYGSGTNDNSGKLPPEEDAATRLRTPRPANESLTRVNSNRVNFNQYVEVAKRWFSNFDEAHGEVIEIVSFLVNESFHSASLSVNVSLVPASGPPSW